MFGLSLSSVYESATSVYLPYGMMSPILFLVARSLLGNSLN